MFWSGGGSEFGKMDCFALTDPGHGSHDPTDHFLVGDLKRALVIHQSSRQAETAQLLGKTQAQLLIVADGIGEHDGQRASLLAVDCFSHFAMNELTLTGDQHRVADEGLLTALQRGLHDCQARIMKELAGGESPHPIGTTLTVALIAWPQLYLVHAGNSRCYLYRGTKLDQLTTDHTFAQKFVDIGVLQAEQATHSRWRNVLWNIIGAGTSEFQPDARELELSIGDTLLLCSDGLSKSVTEKLLAHELGADQSAEVTCRNLIAAANRAGASDNITAVVARFHSLAHAREITQAAEADLPASSAEAAAPAEIAEPDPAVPECCPAPA